jgi:hypothetical protein
MLLMKYEQIDLALSMFAYDNFTLNFGILLCIRRNTNSFLEIEWVIDV